MSPTHNASATGAGVSRIEVSTGLVDRELPSREHSQLSLLREPTADRAPQTRTVGDEVEREQRDGESLQDDAEGGDREPQGAVALALDELLDAPLRVVDLGDHVLGIDVLVEVVVDPPDGAGDVLLRVPEEVGDLRADQRPDRGEEEEERAEHAEEDDDGRAATAPPARRQPVDPGLDREREEQRHEQQDEQAAQAAEQVPAGDRREEAEPEQRDALEHPRRDPVRRRRRQDLGDVRHHA
jgi:hypothetical protein